MTDAEERWKELGWEEGNDFEKSIPTVHTVWKSNNPVVADSFPRYSFTKERMDCLGGLLKRYSEDADSFSIPPKVIEKWLRGCFPEWIHLEKKNKAIDYYDASHENAVLAKTYTVSKAKKFGHEKIAEYKKHKDDIAKLSGEAKVRFVADLYNKRIADMQKKYGFRTMSIIAIVCDQYKHRICINQHPATTFNLDDMQINGTNESFIQRGIHYSLYMHFLYRRFSEDWNGPYRLNII